MAKLFTPADLEQMLRLRAAFIRRTAVRRTRSSDGRRVHREDASGQASGRRESINECESGTRLTRHRTIKVEWSIAFSTREIISGGLMSFMSRYTNVVVASDYEPFHQKVEDSLPSRDAAYVVGKRHQSKSQIFAWPEPAARRGCSE